MSNRESLRYRQYYIKVSMIRSLTLLALLVSLSVCGQSISKIASDGHWYRLYDESGTHYKTASASEMGELVGYSSTLAIFQKGEFYHLYDRQLKQQKVIAVSSVGELLNVVGDTFTTRKGKWMQTYSKAGELLNRRFEK